MSVSQGVSYRTTVKGDGKHASLHIPDEVLTELGTNRRAPLKVTVNGHTYQSTATAVAGECRVVFPLREREAAGVGAGDEITVTLELDSGHREVELHPNFEQTLAEAGMRAKFDGLTYSRRREMARKVLEAKADETRERRIAAAILELQAMGEK